VNINGRTILVPERVAQVSGADWRRRFLRQSSVSRREPWAARACPADGWTRVSRPNFRYSAQILPIFRVLLPGKPHKSTRWADPERDVRIARELALELLGRNRRFCVWTGQKLKEESGRVQVSRFYRAFLNTFPSARSVSNRIEAYRTAWLTAGYCSPPTGSPIWRRLKRHSRCRATSHQPRVIITASSKALEPSASGVIAYRGL